MSILIRFTLVVPIKIVKSSNLDALDYFGGKVAVSSNTVVVVANFEDSNQTGITNGSTSSLNNSNSNSGAVYVYQRE